MNKSLRGAKSESQPDHDTHIQDFLKWSKSPDTFRIGCAGSENEEQRKYIPLKRLRDRLTRRRVEGLLAALLENGERPAPDVDVIIDHYLRPFAILLRIGEGSMIHHFVHYNSLRDDRLPFPKEPSEFPSSTRGNIWAAFPQEQWAFCALTLAYNMSLHIEPDEILPINYKKEITEGGSSTTYKIVVDSDYDKLVRPDTAYFDHQHRNTYVLKTYRTAEAEVYYETEQDAFLRLKDDGMPPSNIIGCYGGFVCKETYNIILEFADLGNLDEYMAHIPPPSTTEEKLTFWDNFLAVINGLVKIHGEGEDDPDVFQILLGWHQDVNPLNVLVKSRGPGRYECDFKIADLGLSHFEKHLSFLQNRNVSTQDNFGTSAYGAPEARRLDEKLQRCNLRVKQNVDIWSLSCVFSEVATWVKKGRDQLAEYRNRRMQEMEQKTGKKEECFHDGLDTLTAVEQSHKDIIDSRRANDPITSEVVNLICDMLVFKEKDRPQATFVYAKSRRIVNDAKAKAESHPRPIDTRSPPLKVPLNFPPNHERHRSGESALVQRPSSGPKVWVPERSLSPDDNGRVYGRSSQASQQSIMYNDDYDETYEQGPSNAAYLPPLQPAQHGYSDRSDRGSSSSQDCYNRWQDAHTIPSNFHKLGRGQAAEDNDFPSMRGFKSTSRRHSMQAHSFQKSSHTSSDAHEGDHSRGNASRDTSYSGASRSLLDPRSGHLESNQTISTPGLGLATLENGNIGPQLPEMSVEEGISQKRLGRPFPREILFTELRARDHVFLVDNDKSMKAYRNEVKAVLELLWDMVAKYDPGSPGLYITTDMKPLKPKTNFRMLQELDCRPANDAPDMRYCIATIIEKHQNRFGIRNIKSRLLHPNSTPAKGPRKLSLYVLTDGVWQAKTDLHRVMRTLVEHLIQHKLTNKQIGIQFIRFGSDEKGKKRLEKLDSGLGLDLDLIDTTPANGNVWKMLLGALNETFDGDPDDEDNEIEVTPEYQNQNSRSIEKGKAKDSWG